MIFEDILYAATDGVATIRIDRPDVFNAFTGYTVREPPRLLCKPGRIGPCGLLS